MVSIIIPVYNVEDYIVKCLESVAEQIYEGAMECLVIDDCGQDDSMTLAEEFMKEYQGNIDFRIIHHKHNKGLSGARNSGIREARGEWLYFLDSDDWIIPECIELMMVQVEKHPGVECVFAGAEVTTKEHPWLDYTLKTLPDYSNDHIWLQYSMLKRYDFGMTAWNKLINREFIIKHNLYFDEGYVHEDEIWNFRASRFILSASFVNKNTYTYNIHPLSIITKGDSDTFWKRHFILWKRMTCYIAGQDKEMQTSGLCRFVLEKTRAGCPNGYRWSLLWIYVLMAYRLRSAKSLLYLAQGLLVLFGGYYNNVKITRRISLI